MIRTLAIATLVVCGCANYYDPKQLTILTLSPSWQGVDLQGADPQVLENALIAGAHVWDPAGAVFRESTDLSDQTAEAIAGAQHLEVVLDDNLEGYTGSEEGYYDPLEGRIHLSGMMIGSNFVQMSATDFPSMLTCICAHEIGHAMALQHVSEGAAIMYAVSAAGKSLTSYDIAEFQKVDSDK